MDTNLIQKELKVTLVDDGLSGIFAKVGEFETDGSGLSTPVDRLRQLPVISRMTLKDFRPSISPNSGKVLYLTRDHLHELLTFLVVEPESEYHQVPLVNRYWDLEHGAGPWEPEADKEHQQKKRTRLVL